MKPVLTALLVLLAAAALSILVGSVAIPALALPRIIAGALGRDSIQLSGQEQTYAAILLQLRLPRTALTALTGAALGGSGAAYQGLFRNPLADPYLIGVASGAGLGAVLAMSLRHSTGLGLAAVPAAAFAGAILTVLLVYLLARSGRTVPNTSLILAGVAAGSFATAVSSFLMLTSEGELRRSLVWLLGGASMAGWPPVLAALPYIAVGLAGLLLMGHPLNVLQFGDEQAAQLGLPVERTRLLVVLAASLTSAAAVAFSGVIGFVGLIVPHLARMIWGVDYRRLIPLSILGGAALLLAADVLARIVLAPQELPVGLVTALFGAPFFLWVLRRSQRDLW
jgi:iron complex transport system permease protein